MNYAQSGTNCHTLLHMRWADASRALTRWQHFSAWNNVTDAIWNVWHHVRNRTPSVDAYLLDEQSCQISTSTIWNDEAWLFWSGRPNNKKKISINKNNHLPSIDIRSIPDPKIFDFLRPSSIPDLILHKSVYAICINNINSVKWI